MTVRNAPDLRLHAGGITEWTRCPQCGAVAEIRRRDVLQSTAGPLEHGGRKEEGVPRDTEMMPT